MSGYWTDVSTSNGWAHVANSYTGQYAIAANNNDTYLYTSNNYGMTWTVSTGSPPTSIAWGGVAISEDGSLKAACKFEGIISSGVYLFKDGNWQTVNMTTPANYHSPRQDIVWQSVYISVDNNTLIACDTTSTLWLYNILTDVLTLCPLSNTGDPVRAGIVSGNIYGFISIARANWINTIYGNNTTGYVATTIDNTKSNINTFFPNNPAWTCISASRDGLKMVICSESSNYIYIGTVDNTGYWTFVKETAPGAGEWQRVQFGPDAVSIVACSSNSGDSSRSGTIWLGNYNSYYKRYIWSQQKDVNGVNLLGDWRSISRSLDPDNVTKFVAVTTNAPLRSDKQGIWVYTSYQSAKNYAELTALIPCFKEGSKILTDHGYIPIQQLKRGDLVKTRLNGFVPIFMIGKKEIYHPANSKRIQNQLYKCSISKYEDLTEDLILTGCHSILIDGFKDDIQRERTREINKDIYVTDRKYRLPACVDDRTTVYETAGTYTIYHFALENDDYYMNYGIFANGLLVETCSKRYIKECSDMEMY